jgi:hypothetical protein
MNFIRVQPSGKGFPIQRLLDRVRRLMRLGDERDLRQLPEAAQGIDAVRLMTIHGAKGLEFAVVHLPGLNGGTLPRSSAPAPCPPPEGMIEGGQGAALDILNSAHVEEQECLFFVAVSRARDRLFTYAPTQKSNGHKYPLSSFLDRLGTTFLRQHVTPARTLPPKPEDADIALLIEGGLHFTAQEMSLYEKCPRRFFYTHVLRIGGGRTMTPFMQMHEAVRTVFQAAIEKSVSIDDEGGLNRTLGEAFTAQGLSSHDYVEDFRSFAVGMLKYFVSSRAGSTPEAPTALSLSFGDEKIIVLPDDVLLRPDGRRTFRRVRSGHKSSTQGKDVEAAAFLLAARKAFPDAAVELIYLSDQVAQSIELSAKELQNRQDKLGNFLQGIRLGQFSAFPSERTCPGCPAFFVCGPTPLGSLRKKI